MEPVRYWIVRVPTLPADCLSESKNENKKSRSKSKMALEVNLFPADAWQNPIGRTHTHTERL